MDEKELCDKLTSYVDSDAETFPNALLIRFKDEGGSQENAYKVCEQLRILYSENETLEDRVLDIIDIVSGWCSPHQRIWGQPLSNL